MNEPNLGTRRSGIYAPPRKPRMGLWLAIAAAAVALVLFLAFGGGDRTEATRGTPAGMGRRPVDDTTVRPGGRPLDRNLDRQNELRGVPADDRAVPPADEGLVPPADVPPVENPDDTTLAPLPNGRDQGVKPSRELPPADDTTRP
jgi:hypothetical protein